MAQATGQDHHVSRHELTLPAGWNISKTAKSDATYRKHFQAVSGDGEDGPRAGRDQVAPNVRMTSSSPSSTPASRCTPSTIRSEVGKQYDSRSCREPRPSA